jgi:hypothetical protein
MTAHKGRKAQCFSHSSIIEPEAINTTRSQFDPTQPALIISRRTAIDRERLDGITASAPRSATAARNLSDLAGSAIMRRC